MVARLVSDLAYDKITLEQGLTRAKLIAFKLKNEAMKNWLSKELNGYSNSDNDIPKYRFIPCTIEGHVVDMWGRENYVPIAAQQINDALNGEFYQIKVNNSISSIEKMVNDSEGERLVEYLPNDLTPIFSELFGVEHQSIQLNHVIRVFYKLHIRDILTSTKQRLLDMLLELEENFGEFDDNYAPSKDEEGKANQIVTYILGNNNQSALGVGNNINQSIEVKIFQNQLTEFKNQLKQYGVSNEDIDELEAKIEGEKDKKSIKKKLLSWLTDISKKSIEKGIEYKIPEIIEAIQNII